MRKTPEKQKPAKPAPRTTAGKLFTVLAALLTGLFSFVSFLLSRVLGPLLGLLFSYRSELAPLVAFALFWHLASLAPLPLGLFVALHLFCMLPVLFVARRNWSKAGRSAAKEARAAVAFASRVLATWDAAALSARLTDELDVPAPVASLTSLPVGVELRIPIPAGMSFVMVRSSADRLLPSLSPVGVERVVILPAEAASGQARVILLTDGSLMDRPVAEWGELSELERDLVWSDLASEAGLTSLRGEPARLVEHTLPDQTSTFVDLVLTIPAGLTLDSVRSSAARLVPMLRAFAVRVSPVEGQSHLARLSVLSSDTLSSPLGAPPLLSGALPLLSEPAVVGLDERGRPATISLVENHLLIAGITGSGKSVGGQSVAMHYASAVRPDGTAACRLYTIDPKVVELVRYDAVAAASVKGSALAPALAVVKEVKAEMDRRYDLLASRSRLKWSVDVEGLDPDLPFILLVIEEIADLTLSQDRAKAEFVETLRELLAKGRAAGVSVMAMTQRPNASVIPPVLRDQFTRRWCHRGADNTIAEIVLGPEGAACDVAGITAPGVGFLLADGGKPTRVRTYFASDEEVAAIVARFTAIPGRFPTSSEAPEAPASAAETPHAPSQGLAEPLADSARPSVSPESVSPPVPSQPAAEDVRPFDIASIGFSRDAVKSYVKTRGAHLPVESIRAELTPLVSSHDGTIAPVAGRYKGKLARLYPAGVMTLVVSSNNRSVLDWALSPEVEDA